MSVTAGTIVCNDDDDRRRSMTMTINDDQWRWRSWPRTITDEDNRWRWRSMTMTIGDDNDHAIDDWLDAQSTGWTLPSCPWKWRFTEIDVVMMPFCPWRSIPFTTASLNDFPDSICDLPWTLSLDSYYLCPYYILDLCFCLLKCVDFTICLSGLTKDVTLLVIVPMFHQDCELSFSFFSLFTHIVPSQCLHLCVPCYEYVKTRWFFCDMKICFTKNFFLLICTEFVGIIVI